MSQVSGGSKMRPPPSTTMQAAIFFLTLLLATTSCNFATASYVQLGNSSQLNHHLNPKVRHNLVVASGQQATAAVAALSATSGNSRQQIAEASEKICIGTSNRFSALVNKTDHLHNLAERYRNCTYVIGNLEITSLEKDADLSFLESIREITGYLLIASVDVERISMPNLQMIRGRELFKVGIMNNTEFAIFATSNKIRQLELPALREILVGSVGFYYNKNLCLQVHWDEIINSPPYIVDFRYDHPQPECKPCHSSCPNACWGQGQEMCQKFSKSTCADQCNGGRCFGSGPRECCHLFCAGGCTGPKQTDCLACKSFYNDGECIQECPPMQRYNPAKFLWEHNPLGKYAFGGKCVTECPGHLLRDNGACVRICPPNKKPNTNSECVPCSGPCPKECQAVEVIHSGNIDQFVNCTVIEGSVNILESSFAGFTEFYPNGTSKGLLEPMHPDRLEVMKNIREITGYLSIQANHSDFKNLSYFRNLQTIGGRQTTDMFYSLSIIKSSLVSLNLRSLKKVRSGRIIVEENKELCFADTINWQQLNVTKLDDIIIRNNADAYKCRQKALSCHSQCSQNGCWGPGPDECLSCKNYKLEDYCVENCRSIVSGSSSFASGISLQQQQQQQQPQLSYDAGAKTCKRCHLECRDGCNGTEAIHCWRCKNVKDGPYCVSECPSHKYNKNGLCEECDKSCANGCTGPSSKLGEGGCNSCAKTVFPLAPANETNTSLGSGQAHCIRADEPCPEGYYQEYQFSTGSSSTSTSVDLASQRKLSPGKPVCRKCHSRCKSCTGLGTHVSVCECSKYIAGEQCEDFCPRDYFANELSGKCVKCSPECNGCFGPTEADCVSCRVYRIYADREPLGSNSKFNCTAQCPAHKPHRISESNMLDPYCSDDPGNDADGNPRIVSLTTSTSILFILILSSLAMVCFSIYRCQIEKDKTVKLTMHLSGIDDVEPLTPSNLKPNLAPLRSIKETELRKGNILGSGFGGTVYQGFWYPEGNEDKKPRPVAIKVLRDNGQSNMNKEFLDEAFIMASINHPNLVRLLAVCMTPNHLMLVTQLMPLGCLLEYVRKYKNDIGSKNLLEWCKQIAKGMAYLEEHRMVHRDLALRNVLLQTCGRALISDFGLAKFLEIDQNEYSHTGGGRLPIKWLAPECIRERKFTHKSDVWAFGVTVWELLTFGKVPFEEYDTKQVPMEIEKGARLQQPGYMSAEVYKVIYSCWFYQPEKRPTFSALAQEFSKFARDPGRYLICGTKGIDYKAFSSARLKHSDSWDEYTSADEQLNSDTEEEPPVSGGGINSDLTPSTTHNRISPGGMHQLHTPSTVGPTNETRFNFDPATTKAVANSVFASSDSRINNPASVANTFKRPLVHHSSNSLGQRSLATTNNQIGAASAEQPTDLEDYLMPSPCNSNNNEFEFREFRSRHETGNGLPLAPSFQRDPPHSAGLIEISNWEYFHPQANSVATSKSAAISNNASSGHIPLSLV